MARDRKRAKQRQRRAAQQPRGQEPLAVDARAAGEARNGDARNGDAGAADQARGADAARTADDQVVAGAEREQPAAPAELEDDRGATQPTAGARGASPADVLDAEDELDETGRRGSARGGRSGAELSSEGNRFINFLRACWAELQRVQWPDRRHVAQATAVVLVFVVIAGGYLGLSDFVFQRLVNAIL